MFPSEDTLHQIGRIVKSYGTEGDVMIAFPEEMYGILKKDGPVFLFYDSLPVPFFIKSIQLKGPRKAIVHFEDIDTPEEAEEASGKEIFADPSAHPELSGAEEHFLPEDGLTLEDLTGFTLIDQKGRSAGIISGIQDFSGNICIEISGSGILVPFHDDLLIGIDLEERTVTLRIEEGLF